MRTLPAIAWIVATSALPVTAQDMSCLGCHQDQKTQFTGSAHDQAGLTCVDCHGGDPKATDETAHATDNFKRPDNKKAIAELCASCHSDVRRMNPYGIPADQLERYKTSKHGEQLFEHSDQKVATCTDCHGVHDIHKVKSPESHVYPTNIPATCGRCHGDEKLMSQYKLPADVVTEYKLSYHAHMLFEKGDLSAPTCVTCHGSHGATPPGTAQVGEVCGKCHVRQRELFAKSPHAQAAAAGKFIQCVGCHGNHAIQQTSSRLFDQSCVRCHVKDAQALMVRDDLIKSIETARGAYERAVERVHDATVRGLATDDEQLLLQEAKTQVIQLEVLQHTLSPSELRPGEARTEEIVATTLLEVNRLERVELWKRLAVVPLWSLMILMAILFAAKRLILKMRGPDEH
jgi:hypothetical protein